MRWDNLSGNKRKQTKPAKEPRYPMTCDDCGKNFADPPGRTCPGCEAYRDHQR